LYVALAIMGMVSNYLYYPIVDTFSDEDIEAGHDFPLATRLFVMPFTMYYKFDLYLFLKKINYSSL